MRVNPDRPDLVFLRSSSESAVSTGGIVGWREQARSEVPLPVPATKIGRMASLGNRIVLLQEYEAVLLNADGSVARRFPADEGFHYFDLDSLPADAENPDVIVLGATSLSGTGSKLVVHDV